MSEPSVPSRSTSLDGVDLAAGFGGTALAVGVSVLGGLAVAVAPLFGAVTAVAGPPSGGVAGAAILTAVLALGVPLAAGLLLRGGRVLAAIGVLSGWAGAGVGAVVLDVQLFIRPIDANRFELFVPTSAATLHAGAGSVVVLVGHVVVVLGGALALWTLRASALLDEPEGFDIGLLGGGDVESRGTSLAGRAGPAATAATGVIALTLAAALFAPVFGSTDPVVLVSAVLDAPRAILLGTALLAVAVLVAVALALVSTAVPAGTSAIAGVALGALAVLAPRWFAAGLLERISPGWGSVLGTLAALVLTAAALGLARSARHRPRRPAADRAVTTVRLPGAARLRRLTAATGLFAGVAAVLAALLPVLSTPAGVPQPQVYAVRTLLLGGVVLSAVCAGLAIGGTDADGVAALLRPVAALAWAAPVVGAGAVLQAVLVAGAAPGVGPGAGAWVAGLSVVLAAACGVSAALAGAVERDDVDTSREVLPSRPLTGMAAGTAVAVLVGFALPLYRGSGVSAAALLSTSWGWDTWALAVVAAVALGALPVVLRARRARGVALLAGLELILAVHLASWPLTAGRLVDSTAGAGVAGTVAALLGVAVLAVLLVRERPA